MPNEYSNFSVPDQQGGQQTAGHWEDDGSGTGRKVWVPGPDPYNGRRPGATGTPVASGLEWGGYGNQIDPETGQEIFGTNGLARDVYRYQNMGRSPINKTGPVINQSQSGESRGVVMGGLGLLQQRMTGEDPTVAEQAGTAQAQQAATGVRSMAATVRGGALARAGAGRAADTEASNIVAHQRVANQAVRAGDMADAREALVGASGALRGQDIGLSKDQGQLDAQQRQLNDQRENYYEDLAHNAQVSQLSARLGRSESEQAATEAWNAEQRALQQQNQQRDENRTDAVTGGLMGGTQGYDKTHSDPRTKQDVRSMTNSPVGAKKNVRNVGSRVRSRASDIIRDNPYDTDAGAPGYDRSMFAAPPATDPETAKLHAGIEKVLGASGIIRQDPYSAQPPPPPPMRFGTRQDMRAHPENYEKGLLGAPKGYARAPLTSGGRASSFEADRGVAPGTSDFEASGKPLPKSKDYDYTRLVMQSPVAAKQNVKELTPEEKAKDEEETRKFLGLKPGEAIPTVEKQTPEQKAAEDKAVQDALVQSHQNRVDEAKLAYLQRQDAENARRDAAVPFFGAALKKLHDDRAQGETREQALARADRMQANHAALLGFVRDANQGAAGKIVHGVNRDLQRVADAASSIPVVKTAQNYAKVMGQKYPNDPMANPEMQQVRQPVEFHRDTPFEQQKVAKRVRAQRALEQAAQRAQAPAPPPAPPPNQERETTQSPVDAKQNVQSLSPDFVRRLRGSQALGTDYGSVPLANPGDLDPSLANLRLGIGADDRAQYQQEAVAPEGQARLELESTPKAKTRAQPKPKPRSGGMPKSQEHTLEEAARWAEQETARTRAALEHPGRASVRDPEAPAPWLEDYMTTQSPVDAKKHVRETPVTGAIRSMHAYEYEYKPQFGKLEGQYAGEKNVGPMADNMAKDPVARTALTTNPDTGMMAIDVKKGLKLTMGGLADLQRQLDELKARRKGRAA